MYFAIFLVFVKYKDRKAIRSHKCSVNTTAKQTQELSFSDEGTRVLVLGDNEVVRAVIAAFYLTKALIKRRIW